MFTIYRPFSFPFRSLNRCIKNFCSFRRAVELRPREAEPHLNLGAMLHLRGKLQEAESQYLEAWSIHPGHANVKINLERLHNIMRKKDMKIRDIVE